MNQTHLPSLINSNQQAAATAEARRIPVWTSQPSIVSPTGIANRKQRMNATRHVCRVQSQTVSPNY